MSKLVGVTTGPATSVQDAGRFGAQRYGLTTSGAKSAVSPMLTRKPEIA